MKYIKDTFKYLKSNLLLLPALAVAIVAMVPIFDYDALGFIARSYSEGFITDSYFAWLKFFLPVNTHNWLTVLLSILAYAVLVVDLAFTHSMVDKHVRFGTKSLRSVMSSLTVNINSGLLGIAVLAVVSFLSSFILAAIMTTLCGAAAYVFIVGAVVCTIIWVIELYILCHLVLWLPCIEITGFRLFEALSYSYSLARPARWKIFAAIVIPVAVALAAGIAIGLTCSAPVTYFAVPVINGCAFLFVSVAIYLAYADTEGVEREDLRKY